LLPWIQIPFNFALALFARSRYLSDFVGKRSEKSKASAANFANFSGFLILISRISSCFGDMDWNLFLSCSIRNLYSLVSSPV